MFHISPILSTEMRDRACIWGERKQVNNVDEFTVFECFIAQQQQQESHKKWPQLAHKAIIKWN